MKLHRLLLYLLLTPVLFAQQASDYFPQQLDYKWNYKISILDSVNNVIPEMTFVRNDSLAFIAEYNGKEAFHILSKTGTEESINFIPYTDTNYVHLIGSDGYEYFNISEIEFLLELLDSATLNNLLPFFGLLNSFNGWHLNYRFAHNINLQYQIFSYDTTITVDTLNLPLRFLTNGKRLQDDTLETAIGTFLCKKFLLTNSINYLIILPPPIPPLVIPVFTIEDTVWIAQDNWVVKDVIPSTNIDLTFFNLGNYNIPGLSREIFSEPTGIKEDIEEKFTFNLDQNYPNPFNPVTNIGFRISDRGNVSLKVYNVLGKEVMILINKELNAGYHKIKFDGDNLSSGVYFYTLEFSDLYSEFNYRITKQMLLIK